MHRLAGVGASAPSVLAGWVGRWSPGIGDASAAGWVTVVAYFVAAWSCGRSRAVAVRASRTGDTGGSARVFTVLAFALVALGVNKQLDLQSAVTELGRAFARSQGWYEQRAVVQRVFVVVVGVVVFAGFAWLAFLGRHELRRLGLALAGAVALCLFVGVRAASFHHVDRFLGVRWGGTRANVLLELGGIATVAVGAWTYRRGERADGPHSSMK